MDYIPFCEKVSDLDYCIRTTEFDFFNKIDTYTNLSKRDLETAMINDLGLHKYHQWRVKPLAYVKMIYNILDDEDIEKRAEPHKLEMLMRTLSD